MYLQPKGKSYLPKLTVLATSHWIMSGHWYLKNQTIALGIVNGAMLAFYRPFGAGWVLRKAPPDLRVSIVWKEYVAAEVVEYIKNIFILDLTNFSVLCSPFFFFLFLPYFQSNKYQFCSNLQKGKRDCTLNVRRSIKRRIILNKKAQQLPAVRVNSIAIKHGGENI